MKGFLDLIEEQKKSVAMLFGRMNPPTAGHEENINGLKDLAKKHNADHVVIASHTHDSKKNPLSPEDKTKHLKRAFPDTNIQVATKEHPTIIQHAKKLHQQGYTHLIVAGGGDRAHEYHKLLHKYNGPGKEFNFKKIEVKSTGERKEGVSGTDMRNHAKSGDYQSFKKNLPSRMQHNEKHAKDLYKDTRKGMGINENVNRGLFKAIFVTGGPSSGKDVIIREAIAEQKCVEISVSQAYDFVANKKGLHESSKDYRLQSIQNRGPLIINGPSDDDRMSYVREELEELGYETFMVFVNTTNEVSMERNRHLSRVMQESVRLDKWKNSQEKIELFYEQFANFMTFDNTVDFQNSNIVEIETKELELSEVLHYTNWFLDKAIESNVANDWMFTHRKYNINELFNKEFNNDTINENDSKSIQKKNLCKHGKLLIDNNCPVCQVLRKQGVRDDVRDGDVASNSGYSNRTYEGTEPTIAYASPPKVPNFQKDKEKTKQQKGYYAKDPMSPSTKGTGIGPTYDTRGQGTVYPMSGLGTSYSESKSFSSFRKVITDSVDSPSTEMGVSGGEHGASNTEPMETPADKYAMTGMTIKKKKGNKNV